MVGGWDKSPGPENHCTSEQITRPQTVFLPASLAAVALLIAIFRFVNSCILLQRCPLQFELNK